MSLEMHLLAERAVPRYTSYPTAPHFNSRVTAATYRDWLVRLPPDARLSLYLHVPFCRDLCFYCGCHTRAVKQHAPVEDYAASLKDEIRSLGQILGPHPVSAIHWGGGTPSQLGPEQLFAVKNALDAAFESDVASEHAIELDPRYVGSALVRALADIGVNRASLGVQTLSPHVQHAMGRVQPHDTVRRAVDLLRESGIDNLSFDLMYGLPRQTVEDVRTTATLAAAMRPRRIALFGYAHVPWFKSRQRLIDTALLPGAAERLQQMDAARAIFLSLGYQAIGFDHFALPDDALAAAARTGRLYRNFQGYTTDDAVALIGIGASAIGRLPQGHVQNAPDIGGYSRAVRSGGLATVRGVVFSDEDRIRGQIIERIMCDLCVDLRNFPQPAGADFSPEIHRLAPLVDAGLVRLDGLSVQVTERGRPFVRLVAAAFDAYLQAGQSHSVAV
jgi:oxygen-independent coproporphyrinogen-3 oxidase